MSAFAFWESDAGPRPADKPQALRRVLLVEDDPDHAEVIAASLGSPFPHLERVETRDAFVRALAEGSWDIVISDFHLPRFSALEALDALSKSGRLIPLIVVSGFVGEEAAAELIKAGAADFTAKSNLQRLPAAISRALREADALGERQRALQALAASEAKFKALVANLPGVVFRCDIGPGGPERWQFLSDPCESILDVSRDELMADGSRFLLCIIPEDRDGFVTACRTACGGGAPSFGWQGRISCKDGSVRWIDMRASLIASGPGRSLADGIINDVTRNMQAQAEVLRSREQLRELSGHLDRAKESERASIAREIHDELGVLLTAAKIELATLMRQLSPERLGLESPSASADALIDQAMDMSRRISRRLRPAVLDYGIVAAIEWQARDFAKRLGIRCELDSSVDYFELDPERSTAVFRIFQEALTNVARHAQARSVRIELTEDLDGGLTLRVADDGCGIGPADFNKPGSFGLRSMAERASALNGRIEVARLPEGGTEVSLQVPMGRSEATVRESGQPPLDA
jgi:two-component system, NarL family, sensor histidine kinase UhpB